MAGARQRAADVPALPAEGVGGRADDAVRDDGRSGRRRRYATDLSFSRRHFCPDCGSGLFYVNAEILPGLIDVQSGTYDDPEILPPQVHVQVAERLTWLERANELPMFQRYPPPPQA